jgi:hypothetical protein
MADKKEKVPFINLPTHNAPQNVQEMLSDYSVAKRAIETHFTTLLPTAGYDLKANHEWKWSIRVLKDNTVTVAVQQFEISQGSGIVLDLFSEG